MSAFGGKADIQLNRCDVCFSNRPVGVKRFQAIHHCGLDVARGLVLLSGLGANLLSGLSVKRTVGPGRHANSPHPSSREGHYFTAWWSSSFLLSPLILSGPYVAAASLVHLNSVSSIQMRCIITANRRASATIAFFIPRCLAIFIAQALSHDHFAERSSMTWAAS